MDEVQELLAEYGQWQADDALTARERAERLAGMVEVLLRRYLGDEAVELTDLDGHPGVRYDFDGRDHLISFAVETDVGSGRRDVSRAVIRTTRSAGLTGRQGDTRWVLLYWSHTDPGPVDDIVDQVQAFGVVLDRTHLDAALTGLRPLAELVRDVYRRRKPHLTLAELLTASKPAADHWSRAADTPQVPAGVVTYSRGKTAAEPLLVAPKSTHEGRPTGMAWMGQNTLLVTCPEGLLHLDTARGRTHWHLPLTGCHGAPLVRDDDILVLCGTALVRWRQGQLTAIAGGFEGGSVLLAGPDGEPWVQSGSGNTLGTGEGATLALTRAGERTGDQFGFPVTFEASVCSAVWLERRRFLLAARGSCAVIDLARTTDAGPREDWIETPVPYPGHVLRESAGSVFVASPDSSGTGIAVHRMEVAGRTSEPVVEARLGAVLGLTQEPGGSSAYLLASLRDNDVAHVQPLLMKITGSGAAALPPPAPVVPADYDAVRQAARGQRGDYTLDRLPFAEGGQAAVFRAEHTASKTPVAFKRLVGSRSKSTHYTRRMRIEVTSARKWGANPHVMPVLDCSPAHDWFVMPLAEATVEDNRTKLQDPRQLRILVDAVACALADAHQDGWIHRDIKPSNILLLNGRWTVADWGIVRRPSGQTSTAGRLTRAGIGTEGFTAPELLQVGHDATPASDIYSLGQLIGWILTGTPPQTNRPLLPPGPWYGVVRQATQFDPALRPQDIAAFLDLIERETGTSELPVLRAQRLLEAAVTLTDTTAAGQLLALAADHSTSYELYLDVLAKLQVSTARAALLANPAQTTDVVQALAEHADAVDWPERGEADRALQWLLEVAQLAALESQWPLLDAAVQGLCRWDGNWDRWDARDAIKDWLRTLTGDAAHTVAAALRVHPQEARYLYELADERQVHQAIRSAVHSARDF